MENVNGYTSVLYNQMLEKLQMIKGTSLDVLQLAEGSAKIIKDVTATLRAEIMRRGFSGDEEEINFFKLTKPEFYKHLIYFNRIKKVELNKPVGQRKVVAKFFSCELDKIRIFYHKHREFYKYYRSGSKSLDHYYFLRYSDESPLQPDGAALDRDREFTTGHDHIVARILANDMLVDYLTEEWGKYQKSASIPGEINENPMLWTGSKASLTELLYAFYSTGIINQGNVTLQQLAGFLERVFKVKLGNYYRAFQEIRIRKKNRTQFLDELKSKLIQKMDYDDEHPR